MDFLDKLVLPEVGGQLVLLDYMLLIAKVLFISFTVAVFGGAVYSLIYGMKKNDDAGFNRKLAFDFIDFPLRNLTYGFGLGIVPFLAINLVYAQMLHQTESSVLSFLRFALFLYLVGIIFLYTYKHSLHLDNVFSNVSAKDEDTENDIKSMKENASGMKTNMGIWGVVFLFFSMYVYIGATTTAANPALWPVIGDVFRFALEIDVWLRLTLYSVLGLALGTGGMFLYAFRDGKLSENYRTFATSSIYNDVLVYGISLPVLLALSVFFIPKDSLSLLGFFSLLVGIISAVIVIVLTYMYKNENKPLYAKYVFVFLIVISTGLALKEKSSFSTSNSEHGAVLASQYTELVEQRAAEREGGIEINAQEIYDAKCMACHRWDQKLVGPPHFDVIPKYVGDPTALAGFIMNPEKINPEYPAMPAQSLRLPEAKALAEYLLQEYEARQGGK